MKREPPRAAVSVVLPTYNEKETIAEAIVRLSSALGGRLLEIIVVDDNSPDGTWKLVQELKHPKVRLIRRMDERGLASAIARGVKEAEGDVIVWMDCDLGLPPEDVPRLVERLGDADVVIGSRYVAGGKDTRHRLRASVSWIFNLYASAVLGFSIRDYTSGFIAVRKAVTDAVPLSTEGFGEYFAEFVYRCRKKGFRVAEVGYIYRYRKAGTSKLDSSLWNFLRMGMNYGWRILKIRARG